MTKLCIFDLDGTVLDTVESIAHYGNYALEQHSIEPIPSAEYKFLAGNGIANLIKNMLNFRSAYTDELYEKVFRTYDDAYNANVSYKSKIFDGLKETLDEIKAKDIKLAIVSNKPDFAARKVVKEIYGDGYFAFVTGQTDGGPLKPDPAVVLNVIKEFGVEKSECIYVGDTSTDMKTGKNAGLYTVGVLWGFRGREELLDNGADVLIEKPEELLNCIK